ncbi:MULTISPECIES: VOC family protein [Arthrobacter]|uniref:VOC family protein n=1 Tax=Arthrobacter terricola TaxID=2547396 RepID=A0A4R5KFL2_9MICC|nr:MULTISPECIES: VOC family protein [Arthrobacter]MBT8162335.1 VOC family protein [Arthrobacter sp. GN70]TDF93408.1 VOC family protein [Arthrobacter terricola]
MQKITTCLWFDSQAGEAAEFYTTLFPGSSIGKVLRSGDAGPGPAGQVVTVEFEIEGREFVALNGGPMFKFTEAVSLVVNCDTQEEVDRYWDALTEGGEESQCGWLKDKFGLSWQIVPKIFPELLSGPDPDGAQRAMAAMLQMKKLDIAALQSAYDGA